jgi:hypothetical protein
LIYLCDGVTWRNLCMIASVTLSQNVNLQYKSKCLQVMTDYPRLRERTTLRADFWSLTQKDIVEASVSYSDGSIPHFEFKDLRLAVAGYRLFKMMELYRIAPDELHPMLEQMNFELIPPPEVIADILRRVGSD